MELTAEVITEMDMARLKRLNEQFIKEAVEAWDDRGEGEFMVYLNIYMTERWRDFITRN